MSTISFLLCSWKKWKLPGAGIFPEMESIWLRCSPCPLEASFKVGVGGGTETCKDVCLIIIYLGSSKDRICCGQSTIRPNKGEQVIWIKGVREGILLGSQLN